MLLKKFRESGPDVLILIIIILLLVWMGAFLHPHPPSDLGYNIKPMPFFGVLLSVAGFNPLFSVVFVFMLVLLVSFLMVNFNTSIFFISERTFLPALIYILLTGLFPDQLVLNPVVPAAAFLILGVRRIIDSYQIQGTAYSFFDAGLLISIGSLFYANMIWFGVLIIVGIVILRTLVIREFIISILGMATPLFIVYGFLYISGKDMNSMLSVVNYNLFTKEVNYNMPRFILAVSILAGIMILLSMVHLLSVINTKKIKSRKTFTLLFWTLFTAAALFFIFTSVSIEILWLAAIPVSYFLSHYFVFARKKVIPEILLAVLFILTASVQIVNLVK
jgi:hypothetical protein